MAIGMILSKKHSDSLEEQDEEELDNLKERERQRYSLVSP
jgi:hypothetical protein